MPPATTTFTSSHFTDVSFKADSPADDHVPSNEFFVLAELWTQGAKGNALAFRSKVSVRPTRHTCKATSMCSRSRARHSQSTGLRKKAEKDKPSIDSLDSRRLKGA